MAIVGGPQPFLLDGNAIVDARGLSMLLDDFEESADPNFSEHQMLDGTISLTHTSKTKLGRVGPDGFALHTWASVGLVDETAYLTLKKIARASFTHNLAMKIPEIERYPTDGTRTEWQTGRQLLGAGYSAVNEIGVNSTGAIVPPIVRATFSNRLTGATYSWGSGLTARTYEILDNTLLVGGDNVQLVLTREDGTINTHTLVAGVDWAIGANAAATAINIAGAIVAATGGDVGATNSANFVLIWKVDSGPGTAINTMTHTTTAAPGAMVVHPNSGELALDTNGPWAFRGVKAGAAPAAGRSVLSLDGYFLYNVAVYLQSVSFAAGQTADGYLPYRAIFKELGESLV